MEEVGQLYASLGLDNKDFLNSLREVETRLKGLDTTISNELKRVEGRFNTTGKELRKVGGAISLGITTPLSVAGGVMLNTAMQFEKSMNSVMAVSGATGAEFKQLEAIAREMGATTKFSAVESAEALNFLSMAGFAVQDSIEALPATLQLAAAGNMDLATSADIVSNVMQGFGLDAGLTAETVDILSKAFTSSNTNLSQLGEAMSYAAPIAKAFQQDIVSATAAVGFLSDAGIQSTRAGTGLGQALVQLNDKADQLGINIKDAAGNMLPLADILEVVEKSGISTSEVIDTLGTRAGPAFATLMERGSSALREFEEELRNSQGTAEQIAETQMGGLQGALTEFQSALSELSISLMENFLPLLTDLVDYAKGVISSFAELDESTQKWIVGIAAAAAALGPLLLITGQTLIAVGAISGALAKSTLAMRTLTGITRALTLAQAALNAAYMANPIGVMVAGVAALGAAYYAYTKNVDDATRAEKAHADVIDEVNKGTAKQTAEINKLTAIIENGNMPLQMRKDAIEELNAIVPEYNGHLTDEGKLIDHNTGALTDYINNLKESMKVKAQEKVLTQLYEEQAEAVYNLAMAEQERKKYAPGSDVLTTRIDPNIEKYKNQIEELDEAIDSMNQSFAETQAGILTSNMEKIADNLTTIQDKVQVLTFAELDRLETILSERLTDATNELNHGLEGIFAEQAKERVNQYSNALEIVREKIEGTGQEAEDAIEKINKLSNQAFSLNVSEDIGVGLFDTLLKEFDAVDAVFSDLQQVFNSFDLRKEIFVDFDVNEAKISAVQNAIDQMIPEVTAGNIDMMFLEVLIDDLERLKEIQAEELLQDILESAKELSNVFDQETEFLNAIGSDADLTTEKIRALENQLRQMYDLANKGTEEWQETWDNLMDQLSTARAEQEITSMLETIETNLQNVRSSFAELGVTGMSIFSNLERDVQEKMLMIQESLASGAEVNSEHIQNLVNEINEMTGFAMEKANALNQAYEVVGQTVADSIAAFGESMAGAEASFKQFVGSMLDGLQQVIQGLFAKAVAAMIAGESSKGLIGLGTALIGVSLLKGLWQRNVPEMATGGRVPPGYDNDTYPAYLTSGETVLPERINFDELLQAMKSVEGLENDLVAMKDMDYNYMNTPTNMVYEKPITEITNNNTNNASEVYINIPERIVLEAGADGLYKVLEIEKDRRNQL